MAKILITGGNGFIGKNLLENLKGKISAPTHQELELTDGAEVENYVKKKKFDIIIHSAIKGALNPCITKCLDENLSMFLNIARHYKHFGKMIYFGSGAEFSREHWKPLMPEDYFDKYKPKDDYGLSKYWMTKYTLDSPNIYNLRLFGIFGKYEDKSRFITKCIWSKLHNQTMRVNQNTYFDFTYVNDLIKIVKWFIENKPKEKVYNTCTGKYNSLESISQMILPLSLIRYKPCSTIDYSGDNSRLINEMPINFTPLEEAIKELEKWLQISCVNK